MIPDREKIIKDWESILSRDPLDVPWDLIDETLTLLKEREAVKVRYTAMGGLRYGACPHCDARVDNLVNPKACGFCGQELKWE